jgi:hypothetical protein
LPVKVLSRVFRGKFLAGLKRLHRRKKLCCSGPSAALADQQQFARLLRHLHRHDWVVYARPAFAGPLQVLRYLGRYTHRVAISNHCLLAFEQERVTFRWKDYAHRSKQGRMTLAATEFLRRFFLHVLPKVSYASVTTGLSLIAFASLAWRCVDNCWPAVPQCRKQSDPGKSIARVPRYGIAPAAAQLCSSFRDLQLRNYPHACTSILPGSPVTNDSGMRASTPAYSCVHPMAAAGISTGRLFRCVCRAGKHWGDGVNGTSSLALRETVCEKTRASPSSDA